MKAYLEEIIARIREGAFYQSQVQKCPVDSACEVEAIKDEEDREVARDYFFGAYGLTSQVWARIPKRFPNFRNTNASGTRALAYLCQLPIADCRDLYIEMVDHLDEPNVHDTARRRVNEIKEAKKQQRKPRAAKASDKTRMDFIETNTDIGIGRNGQKYIVVGNETYEADTLRDAIDDALAAREKAVK